MATVYRIKPVHDQDVTFRVMVWTAAGEYTVTLKGSVRKVAADLRDLTLKPGFRKWRKVGS